MQETSVKALVEPQLPVLEKRPRPLAWRIGVGVLKWLSSGDESAIITLIVVSASYTILGGVGAVVLLANGHATPAFAVAVPLIIGLTGGCAWFASNVLRLITAAVRRHIPKE